MADNNMDLYEFVENHHIGKQYDSCVESPCMFTSHSGCRHPKHPKNEKVNMTYKITVEELIDKMLWRKYLEMTSVDNYILELDDDVEITDEQARELGLIK